MQELPAQTVWDSKTKTEIIEVYEIWIKGNLTPQQIKELIDPLA